MSILSATYGLKTWEGKSLPWDKDFLTQFAKENLGLLGVNPYNKEAIWFESCHIACNYFNTINGLMGKFDDPKVFISPWLSCHSSRGECAREGGRVYQGYIWMPADMFSEEIIKENYHFLPYPVKNNKGKSFDSVEFAAKWLKEEGYTTASEGTIIRSVRNNVEGKTKTSYGMVWSKL